MLTEIHNKFSDTINTFMTHIIDEGNEMESDTASQEEDIDTFSDNETNATENDLIGPCYIQTFWNKELNNIKNMRPTWEDDTGDINKYHMPRFFKSVVKKYLPFCMIWSNLLIGDLTRHSAVYSFFAKLTTSVEV